MKRRILSVAVIALTCAAPLCAQMAGETAAKNVSSLTLAGGKTDLTNRLTIALAAGSAGALTWTLPMSNGTSGYSLQTDGAGNLSWGDITTFPGTLAVAHGGTGLVTLTSHALQVGAGTSAITQLAVPASGTLLTGVATSDPAFSATPTLGVAGTTTGQLKLANATGANVITLAAPASPSAYTFTLPANGGTDTYVLQTDGSGGTSWAAASGGTNPLTTTGDMIYSSPGSTQARLPIGSSGQILSVSGGIPAWASLTSANQQLLPSPPAGTTSTSGLMMGLGGTITPTGSGNVLFLASGDIANNSALGGAKVRLRYGTGAAPSAGAAEAGTAVSGYQTLSAVIGADDATPFAVQGLITGLTLSTAYWYDLEVAAITAGTATPSDISLTASEESQSSPSVSISTAQLLSTAATDSVSAYTGNSYTSSSVATYAGRVAIANTSGGTLGSITVTVNNSKVTSHSVIIVTTETDLHSASAIQYIAQVGDYSTRVAGTSFQVTVHRATPSGSASFVNNEGLIINYIIIN